MKDKSENKTTAYLVTLIGILLILPMLGVTALGSVSSGIAGWVISLAILIMGITLLTGN
ncbi:MAG: hypothetical protein NUV97_01195 [archaeon]|nr:hypothetical protein [archaeon]MCR4323422.1 hypothetical protein [Nanoarchaeota archaeon]